MSLPDITTRDEWLAARTDLLRREKDLTRARDALAADRRRLPMVKIEQDYRFAGREGEVSLRDLFRDHHQLIVRHFMFDPAWDEGCPSCSAGVDEVAPGLFEHLASRDTRLVYVSRAQLDKLDAWQRVKGWDIPWYSSGGGTFNYDFDVTLEPEVKPPRYNFREVEDDPEWQGCEWPQERPGSSMFLRVDDDVFHTYSVFARGVEDTSSSYQLLDMTALGRQEDWEEPKGRAESVRTNRPDFAS